MSQQERFSEFLARADVVKDQLAERFGGVEVVLELQQQAAMKAPSVAKKIHWLRKGAATIASAVDGLAACGAACDACCHIPVMLLASEAKVIGKEIGIQPLDVPVERRDVKPPTFRGEKFPCPFLRDKLCSIRESRPLACRLLFNLDRDNYLCQHHELSSQVPYLDTRPFEISMGLAIRIPGDYVAELRDFFPNGLDG